MSSLEVPSTMKAAVVSQPGGPSVIQVQTLPVPKPQAGQVLIRIRAAGLNRSELFTRRGDSPGVKFPRVLGIECVGIVASCPDGEFIPGEAVATAMAGIGRDFDGGYAEYTCVPVKQVRKLNIEIPETVGNQSQGQTSKQIDWATIGAIPEMMQTAWGSLVTCLRLQAGDKLLIRGGTTSIGLAAASLVKNMLFPSTNGKPSTIHITSTTRRDDSATADLLTRAGADSILVDNGHLSASLPPKFNKILELIGPKTLRDSLKLCTQGGIVCQTGIVGNTWHLADADRNPMELIPNGVFLTVATGGHGEFMAMPLGEMVRLVQEGTLDMGGMIGRVFHGVESFAEGHEVMERNEANGKVVVVL